MTKDLTQKEMLIRLMDKTEDLPAIRTSLEGIEKHLEELNSKVATNVKDIKRLDIFKTRVTVYGSIALFFVPYFINKYLGV